MSRATVAFDRGQNHRDGVEVTDRRPGKVAADDSALPRKRACAQSNEGDATMLLVVAPLRFGHRSVLSGGVPRRRSQAYVATAMQGAREDAVMR
jgi:hypothetical protein